MMDDALMRPSFGFHLWWTMLAAPDVKVQGHMFPCCNTGITLSLAYTRCILAVARILCALVTM